MASYRWRESIMPFVIYILVWSKYNLNFDYTLVKNRNKLEYIY